MGKSNQFLEPFYKNIIEPKGDIALLGFQNNKWFSGDLYDLQLNNWQINSDWNLSKKYDTIISLRCPYFAKEPIKFIDKCLEHLNSGGTIYADWGLGDHWRFDNYKVGWVKDGEHEWAYEKDNYLWSTYWNSDLLQDTEVQKFEQRIQKKGYSDLEQAIYDEVPSVFNLQKYTNYKIHTYALWEEDPQLYILLEIINE